MLTPGSPDIAVLQVEITWDISGVNPQILLTNLSAGPDLAACSWWFKAYSPSTTSIHEGEESDPDIIGSWTTYTLSDAWPKPFNQIEWSGAPYTFQAFVKDGNGNVYAGDVQSVQICRPQGNTPLSKNTYGLATCYVQVNCAEAGVFFQDTTNHSYRGLDGTIGSSVLRVIYPIDETGTIPDPFVADHFSVVQVPITYSSDNYQFMATSIYDYEFDDYTHVRIKYQSFNPRNGSPAVTFKVLCNIDLCPLVCEYDKFIQKLESGNCADAEKAHQDLVLMNSKMSLIMIGIKEPLCGIDVPSLIDEVKEIGGFECNCCNAATGIIPTSSSVIDGYTFQVVSVCGDISGTVTNNGNLIQFNLQDKSYVFKICDASPGVSSAFTVTPSTDGCVKTYCLNVDTSQFAYDLAEAIGSDGDLLSVWQALFPSTFGDMNLVVDGGCIFQSGSSCDYTYTLTNVPSSGTFALAASLFGGGSNHILAYSFNLTNLPGFQAYLNTLGLGTFVVINTTGNTVVITSLTNSFQLGQFVYKISGTTYVANQTTNCTGYTPISANEVIQNMINYICGLDDSQIITSQAYEICYIDPATNTQQTSTIESGVSVTAFIQELLSRGCDTINYVISLGAVNCASIKQSFPALPAVTMQANDYFLGTKANACAQVLPTEAFLAMLTYGASNAQVLAAFCNMVTLCSGGFPCAPYDIFFVEIDQLSPGDDIIDLIVTFDHPDAISNNIRYARIDNTNSPTYITLTGILPGQSPYTIPGLSNGQYNVYMRPVYADGRLCPETLYTTPSCEGINSFSVEFDGTDINVTYSLPVAVEGIKVNIYYPNGGFFSQIYVNGSVISIPAPTGVYGTFFATVQPVCNIDTGFFGEPTGQVAFVINPADNSTITNNSSVNLIVSVGGDASTQFLEESSLTISSTLNFYVPDGTYNPIIVKTDPYSASYDVELVTGTGTYMGVPNGSNGYNFASIPVLNGIAITITDGSP